VTGEGDLAGPPRHAPERHRVPTRVLAWALAALFTVLVAAAAVNLDLTLTRNGTAACSFYRDLAGLPVTILATTGRPSELGMSIIANSRAAYRDLGCQGPLPPPSPSFTHWASYYRLPAG
jgi:hypothetical protein